MKRHKNLERAIVLSLMLSTGIYGTAFAETMNSGLWTDANKEVEAGEDLTINASGVGIGFDGTVNVMDGDLTVNATSNGILSGYGKDMQVQILANNVKIDADDNGIFTTWGDSIFDSVKGYSGKVIIGSSDRNIDSLDITSGGQGIDNKWGKVEIYGKENSTINIHSTGTSGDDPNQAAINNSGSGDKGIVNVNGGDISLRADKGNGITNGSGITTINSNKTVINASVNGVENSFGTTTINGKDITINSKQNAVHNTGSGTINITSKGITQEGVSTLDDQYGYDISLVGEEENGILSDGTGTTNVIADNDIIIAGKENGILSNKDGQINVTAGNNNVIGQYTDEEGTHTSQTGINVSSGTVTITSGNENNIYGTQNGIYATGENSEVVIKDADNTNANTNIKVNNEEQKMAYGIYAKDDSKIDVDTNNLYIETIGNGASQSNTSTGIKIENNALEDSINIKGEESITIRSKATQLGNDEAFASGGQAYGLYVQNAADVVLDSSGTVSIIAESLRNLGASGIDTSIDRDFSDDTVEKDTNVTIKGKDIIIGAVATNGSAYGVQASINDNAKNKHENTLNIIGENNIGIFSKVTLDDKNKNARNNVAINSSRSTVNVESANGSIILVADNEGNVCSDDGKYVTTVATGIQSSSLTDDYSESSVSLYSKINNEIYSDCTGVQTDGSRANIKLTAQEGNNIIYSNYDESASKGISSRDGGTVILTAINGVNDVRASNVGIYAANYVRPEESSMVALSAKINNIVSNDYTIYAKDTAFVELYAQENNLLAGDMNAQGFGSGHAIQAASASNVDLNALGGNNNISGVIYAKDDNTVVNLTHEYPQPVSETKVDNRTEGSNIILSSAHGTEDRTDVVAAVYAQSNGEVNIVAGKDGYNYIATDATLTNDKDREQTVWAQQGGKINIDGQTTIVASNADVNTNNIGDNSLGIAITAGTGDISGLEELPPLNTTQDGNEIRSTVNITNASGSSITGDIVSGYGGLINIGMDVNNKTRAAGTVENIKITGNALAANGGKLNINLGNGGTWTGRADDYGDAGYGPDAENHQNFYNPAFSNDILEGGTVNLTMGDNSTWKVQGQSWITSVDTTNAQNATIDLVEANTDRNTTSHALTIYDLKGNANINMNLDGDRDVSDMLYVKNAQGEYNVALADAVTTEDMYANGLDGLRFATVGAGSNVKFNAGSYDAGVFNVEYEVGTDAYDGNDENVVYNGNRLDVEKPGTSTVDSFFGYQGEDPNAEENTSEIATYARMAEEPQVMALAEEPATETTATTKEATATGATNYKLIARKGESLSDAGKTILNMSKANYSQAVYLDTLNKRLGEARYLEGDEGLWVRMRHDKIDKDSSYEITNNMYELGYDKKYESKDKNGYHRKGVAIDYMDGDTSYDDIAGSGETNRKGIWLYDTWIGNKGHYTDYVAKWGHLENSFDLYTKTRGEKVSGEYDNDVYSLSAEWGYKDQLNNDWYIEPQVQLQYARVTGADYETSQGTQVSVDGIDSLIARAGFRLGKDFGEEKKSTFYVKADVLHEFLGDQDITAMDKTTDGRLVSIGYDNDGTWYSVGLGFSTMLSDNSYAFLDVEKIFGNDNDNSYQINGGFNWLL